MSSNFTMQGLTKYAEMFFGKLLECGTCKDLIYTGAAMTSTVASFSSKPVSVEMSLPVLSSIVEFGIYSDTEPSTVTIELMSIKLVISVISVTLQKTSYCVCQYTKQVFLLR